MQIVIDIDRDQYEMVKQYSGSYDFGYAIARGTVLPENHGRLIDADALNFADIDNANYGSNYIRIAPTIIEADNESEVSE